MDYDVLFEPIKIRDVEIKNRIVMAPMNMVYSDPEGYCSEQWLAWYAARAKGGFGLIITDATVVNPYTWRGSDHLNTHLFTDERYGRRLGILADHIHAFGAKVFIQLSPGFGRQGHASAATPHLAAGAPSAIADPFWPAKVKAGREKDIVKCARCNTCPMNLFEHKWLRCSVNPTAGFEKYMPELWRLSAPTVKGKVEKFTAKAEGLPLI